MKAGLRFIIAALFLHVTLLEGFCAVTIHKLDGSFIREWLVLGPFPSRSLETDFLSKQGGEENIQPLEGDVVTGNDGVSLKWIRYNAITDFPDFDHALELSDFTVVYAYCELSSDQSLATYMRAFAGQDAEIWLNGESLGVPWSVPKSKYDIPAVKSIELKEGKNRLLLKMRYRRDQGGFMIQFLPPDWTLFHLTAIDSERTGIAGALFQFYQNGKLYGQATADASGKIKSCIPPGNYDLRVTSGNQGQWFYKLVAANEKQITLECQLSEAPSIRGKVLAMDNSPQSQIMARATLVSAGELSRFSSFSELVPTDNSGNFAFINLPPGRYQINCNNSNVWVDLPPVASSNLQEVTYVFPEIKKGTWKSYPITEGLKELNPSTIIRLADGTVWVGTHQSLLYSFDGLEFVVEGSTPDIPANEIHVVKQGFGGAVWIGTSGGICRKVNGRITNIPFPKEHEGAYVTDILPEKDGTVWIGTRSGLFKFNGKAMSSVALNDGIIHEGVYSILRAHDGVLWVGTSRGLLRSLGQKFTLLEPLSGFASRSIAKIYQAKDQSIWFANFKGGGVCRLNGNSLTWFGIEHGFLHETIEEIAETSDGTIWFATRHGLSKLVGTNIINYTEADGLSNNWVRDIFIDSDDVIWAANGWGISRFDPKGLVKFGIRDGLKRSGGGAAEVFSLYPSTNGNVLLGTGWRGTFESNGKTLWPVHPSLALEYVRQIQPGPDGEILFGASKGIFAVKDGRFREVLARNWILALCSDRDGNIWFGHGWRGGGAGRYNPRTKEEILLRTQDGLPDDQVWALAEGANGEVWIGTGSGLCRYKSGKIETIADPHKLGGVFKLHLAEDKKLWITSRQGLEYLEDGKRIKATSVAAPSTQLTWSSLVTEDGKIWLATEHHGLIGYDGRAVTMLDRRDGMAGNSVFTIATNDAQSLWVGFLDGGLTRYRLSNLRPSVRLQGMLVDNHSVTNLSIPPNVTAGRRVTFQYREIDHKTHPDKRQFWYKIVKKSGEIVTAAVTKERRFEWVPPKSGSYTFEIQAIDRDLNYSDPARVMFQVLVPWHANLWLLIPAGLAFVGLLIWAFVARNLYVRKSREAVVLGERVRMARDLHDHLGAGLTHLAMMGDLVRDKADESATVKILANRLGDSARDLTRTMGEIIWTTDPEKDTLQSFALFISRYAERFFEHSNLRLRFDIPTNLPTVSLPPDMRNNLFLVTKEALNNVAKHSGATELHIKLELTGRDLHLIIEDNGEGFSDPGTSETGHGLENMKKRLADLGGVLKITKEAGKGVTIHAIVRLPKT